MKSLLVVLVLLAGLIVGGCSSSDNPLSVNSTAGIDSPSKHGLDDPPGDDRSGDDHGGMYDHNGGGNDDGVRGNRVEGTITNVDLAAKSVTIRTSGGSVITVFATGATKIERNDLHTSLSAFKVGDRGQAEFDPATMIATKIESTGL